MSLSNPTIPTLIAPKLFDEAFLQIANDLQAEFDSWPLYAYGKCQKLVKQNGSRKEFFPAMFYGAGQNDYLSLLPDSHIGNFSFFVLEDSQEIMEMGNPYNSLSANFGLIFWFNLEDIYPSPANWKQYSIENVKDTLLTFLTQQRYPNVRFEFIRIWEEADNIYKGFSHKEIEDQFLMRPYAGLRFDGKIEVTSC